MSNVAERMFYCMAHSHRLSTLVLLQCCLCAALYAGCPGPGDRRRGQAGTCVFGRLCVFSVGE